MLSQKTATLIPVPTVRLNGLTTFDWFRLKLRQPYRIRW